ncbi:ABC transporter substrate-binding protein/permease [Candidatus Phytoplasma solani]|uniref:ABC transporter substrate-binding protein/permease n=1 Tax=Candidatus Phytoplasma solani TaxID=69896 RepID=UPI00358DFF7E
MKRSHLIIILLYLLTLFFVLWADLDFTIPFNEKKDSKEDLIVGMELEYLPLGYLTSQNNQEDTYPIQGQSGYAVGYDITIAQLLAKNLDRHLVIKKISFDGLIPALQNNEIQLVIAGLSKTEAREKEVAFSEPYCFFEVKMILTKSKEIKELQDLKNLKIGFQNGSSYANSIAKISDFSRPFSSYNDLEISFLANDIDGFIAESFLADFFLNQFDNKGKTIPSINTEITQQLLEQNNSELLQSRFALNQKNQTLLQKVNEALKNIKINKDFSNKLLEKAIQKASQNHNDNHKNLWDVFKQYRSLYLQGLMMTFKMACLGTMGAFFLALLLVYAKGLPKRKLKKDIWRQYFHKYLKLIIDAYIFTIKSIPMMVQAMLFYYGLKSTGYFGWLTPFQGGLIVISFNSAAYLAETMLKNLQFFDPGQIEAGLALGMTDKQIFKKVVLPQVIHTSLLRIYNEFINNTKDSCVFGVIGVFELVNATSQIRGAILNINVFFIPIIIYLFLTAIAFYGLKKLEKRQALKR